MRRRKISGKRILLGSVQMIVTVTRNRSTKATPLNGTVRFGTISMGMGSGGALLRGTSNESMACFPDLVMILAVHIPRQILNFSASFTNPHLAGRGYLTNFKQY